MSKPRTKIKRPSAFDEIATVTARSYSHLHSASVQAKLDLLTYEDNQLSEKQEALKAATAQTVERRKQIHATIIGLNFILERR